jgi:hypothetical protein
MNPETDIYGCPITWSDRVMDFIEDWLGTILISFALIALALSMSGCAYNRPSFREQSTATNGVVTVRELSVPTWALWPATSSLSHQKASLSNKSFTLGTSELQQEGQSTNAVEALREMRRIFEALPR